MSTPFATLCYPVEIEGIGLHTGASVKVRLLPRDEVGLIFARVDLPNSPEVAASASCIGSTHHATTLLQNGVSVGTPEHLLAPLWALGVTNCRIELDACEVPILDGSAAPWCELIYNAGLKELGGARPEYSLRKPAFLPSREGAVLGLPHSHLRVTLDVDYQLDYLPPQVFGCDLTSQSFISEMASARTFALESWITPLQERGLIRGGREDNALVMGETAPSSLLRFPTELARHKAIDLIGDVALLFAPDGGIFHAHLLAIRAGHEMHRLWMEAVLHSEAMQRVET